jgi:hypothetical protein
MRVDYFAMEDSKNIIKEKLEALYAETFPDGVLGPERAKEAEYLITRLDKAYKEIDNIRASWEWTIFKHATYIVKHGKLCRIRPQIDLADAKTEI